MEELLKEVALSERRKKRMDSFIEEITDLLQSVPETLVVEVCTSFLDLCTFEPDFTIVFLSDRFVIVLIKDAFCLLAGRLVLVIRVGNRCPVYPGS